MSRIIVKSKEIPICENCFKRRFCSYTVSPLDLSYCIECVRSNRSGYDVIGPIVVQFEILFSIYVRFEAELEDVFEK